MKKLSLADKCVISAIFMIGMAEAGHLLMVFGNRPFSDVVKVVSAMFFLYTVALIGYEIQKAFRGRKEKGRGVSKRSTTAQTTGKATGNGLSVTVIVAGMTFGLLVLYQLMTVASGEAVYRTGDMTVETVESILRTGTIYQVNPLTGGAYQVGVPLRIRVLGLPTLYAVLCNIFNVPADVMVEKVVPTGVLLLGYIAYGTVAGALFPDKKDLEKRLIFLAAVAAILCAGNYASGMDGFGVLYCGYRGTTIRSMILLPYTFGLVYRKKFSLTVFCILAELCIVWTLYGMGQCLFVVALAGGIYLLLQKRNKGFRKVGEESGL